MRLRFRITVAAILVASAAPPASAQVWNDAATWNTQNVSEPASNLSTNITTPTTDLAVQVQGATCSSALPTFTGPQVPISSTPNGNFFGPTNCTTAGTMNINLNEFARQSEFTDLSTGLTGLSSDVSGLTAQLNALSSNVTTMTEKLNQAIRAQARIANIGVSQALAMAGTGGLQEDEHFAVSINVASYQGESAFAGSATARITDHLSINGGVASGTHGTGLGARAGLRFGW